MKKTIILGLFSILIFAACKKDKDDTNNSAKAVRYEFSATMAGNYNLQTITDTLVNTVTINTNTWTSLVNVTGSDSASFTVFPPLDWINTSNEADVSLKIFVNNVEKASGTAHFIGLDRPNGLHIAIQY